MERLIRPDLVNLKPYSSARSEFGGNASIWLDANESPSGQWNRYPDTGQRRLKMLLAERKGIRPEQVFIGNGSDEVLDLILRLTTVPFKDCVAALDPSYGMYELLSKLNGLNFLRIALDHRFSVTASEILEKASGAKVLMICRPNNPTGNAIAKCEMEQLLEGFPGVLVVDEAYIDFCPEESLLDRIDRFPHLVIVQTLSKAWGMAGLRIGMAMADSRWIEWLDKIRPPYNIGTLTQETAERELIFTGKPDVETITGQRAWMEKELLSLRTIVQVFPSKTNFLLVRVRDAASLYGYLTERGVIVRNRSNQSGCANTLRITIGSADQNKRIIALIQQYERKESTFY